MPRYGEPQLGPWAAVSQGKDCASQGLAATRKKILVTMSNHGFKRLRVFVIQQERTSKWRHNEVQSLK